MKNSISNDRLYSTIELAHSKLMEVCHGDHEHQIECHSDTIIDSYRRLALAAEKAFEILNTIIVNNMEC